jgi:hypothetical protein
MLNNKTLLILIFIICLVLPLTIHFTRTGFFDGDSYFWMNYVCHPIKDYNYEGNSPLGTLVFSYFPCNELFVKIVLAFLLILNIIAMYKITDYVFPKQGHLGILFAMTTSLLFQYTLKFENDSFGFAFMLFSFYFFLRYLKERKIIHLGISLFLLGIGIGFWGGGIYYYFFYALLLPFLFLPLLLLFFVKEINFVDILTKLWQTLFGNPDVQESNPVLTIFYLWVGYFSYFRNLNFYMKWFTILFVIIGLFNPKFLILGLPLFTLSLIKAYNEKTPKDQEETLYAIMIISSVMTIMMFIVSPTPTDHESIIDGLELSQQYNKPISNDWELGHLVFYYGGTTLDAWGGIHDLNHIKNSIIVTKQDLNCPLLKTYSDPFNFAHLKQENKIYNC